MKPTPASAVPPLFTAIDLEQFGLVDKLAVILVVRVANRGAVERMDALAITLRSRSGSGIVRSLMSEGRRDRVSSDVQGHTAAVFYCLRAGASQKAADRRGAFPALG